jgi:dihydroneopterin triphosphate diphosphatase
MIREFSSGGLVIRNLRGRPHLAVVRVREQILALPKGHPEHGESAQDAALREVREETGLEVQRLYNVCVQPFYLHRTHTVELAVVFAAFVDPVAEIGLGEEHMRAEWLVPERALERFVWPRERAALRDILILLASGDAGPVEDVLRVF